MEKTFEIIIGNQRITAYANIRGDQLAPGDLYIAKRNTGWYLAKCLYVNHQDGWVMPDPPASIYSYDCHECAKVKSIAEIKEGQTLEYDFRHYGGHIEVYDQNRRFLFSADTILEAKRELEGMNESNTAA